MPLRCWTVPEGSVPQGVVHLLRGTERYHDRVERDLRPVVDEIGAPGMIYSRAVADSDPDDAKLRDHLNGLDDDELFELFADQTASVARFAALVKTALKEGYAGDGILPLKAQASSVRQLGIIAEEFVDRVIGKELRDS
jgi:hypothetical protein